MTGIQINGEFLDLPQNVVQEIIRNSPYINNDEIEGEYSLPMAIPYTDKNYRILQYIGNHYKQHVKYNISANLYGDGGAIYPGTLVIDGFNKNMNQPSSVLTNGLFTFSISSFLQQVKDKKLSDLQFGGTRTFNWTTDIPYDGSGGFWQHVHSLFATPGDYTFFPIKNEGYGEYGDVNPSAPSYKIIQWMNKLQNGHTVPYLHEELNISSLCPSVKLSYIIEKVFTEHGWTLDGEVLLDVTFNKLFVQSFRGIYWCDYSTAGGVLTKITKSTIDINLNEHVPPDYPIRNFIIDLKNRYGWAFVFEKNKRNCTIKFLKNVANNGQTRDLTAYANSMVNAKFDQVSRIISLRNNIDISDSYPQTITSTNFPTITTVMNRSDLPNPATETEGVYCLVFKENTYYQVISDGTSQLWDRAADNIGDLIVDGETEAITTDASTFATSFIGYRYIGPTFWYGIMPQCNQPGNWYQNKDITPWKLRTIIYHGLQYDIRGDGSTTGQQLYPMASSCTTDNYGADLGGNSNVYIRDNGTINNGLYETAWKQWIELYKKTDVRTFMFNLPLYLLYDLTWEDIIIIHNVHFLIKKMKYNIPYSGKMEMDLLKIY